MDATASADESSLSNKHRYSRLVSEDSPARSRQCSTARSRQCSHAAGELSRGDSIFRDSVVHGLHEQYGAPRQIKVDGGDLLGGIAGALADASRISRYSHATHDSPAAQRCSHVANPRASRALSGQAVAAPARALVAGHPS